MLTHMHKMMIALPEEVLTQLKQAREPGESDDFAAIAAALDTLKEFLERPGNSVSEIVHSPGSHQLGEEVGFLVQLCSLDMCSDIAAAAVDATVTAKNVKRYGKALRGYADALEVAVNGYVEACEEFTSS